MSTLIHAVHIAIAQVSTYMVCVLVLLRFFTGPGAMVWICQGLAPLLIPGTRRLSGSLIVVNRHEICSRGPDVHPVGTLEPLWTNTLMT